MQTSRILALVVGCAALTVAACQKVPYTGRRQLNLIPNGIMNSVGQSSYAATLSGAQVKKRGEDNETLQRVGGRISKVANEPRFAWEFSLLDEEEINAWCLPGGYIAFYTGILPVLKNEAGMAFVMGHEVAHATAHHGSERLSQQLTLLGGLVGLELYLANQTELTPEQRGILLASIGLGAEVGVMLPFSRSHEAEADIIGMMYMADAGYPPEESKKLWDRMEAESPSSIPTFLSTHPSNDRRKANLQEWMPEAKKKYERNKLPGNMLATLWSGASGSSRADQGKDRSRAEQP